MSDIESRGSQVHRGEILKTMLCASGTWKTPRKTSCPPPQEELEVVKQRADGCTGDSGGNWLNVTRRYRSYPCQDNLLEPVINLQDPDNR